MVKITRIPIRMVENLKENVGISYAEFGAKLDGVTDDTLAIRAAHDYANLNNLPVVQKNATFVLNGEIEAKTNVDLTGSTLITTWVDSAPLEYNRTSYLYKITGAASLDITSQVVQSEFAKGSTVIPSLASFNSGSIVIKTNEVDLVRNDSGTTTNVLKSESNAVSKSSGGSLAYPLTKDYTTSAGFQVLYTPLQEKLLFHLPKVVLKGAGIYSVVQSYRNNVEITGGVVEEQNASTTISPLYTIAEFIESHDIKVSDTYCPIIGRNQKTGSNGLGYLYLFTKSSKIKVDRISQLYGWSGINGNWFRDISVTNSNIISINGHANTYDLSVKDCRVYEDIEAHGGGILDIDNVIFEGRDASVAVTTRRDYASEFEGTIRVRNSITKGCSYFVQVNDVTYDCGRKVSLPNVEIINCRMEPPTNRVTYLYTWRGFTGEFNATLPNVKIDGYSIVTSAKHKTLYFPQTISNTLLSGTINVEINGAKVPVASFNSNPFSADLMNIQLPNISNNNVTIKLKMRNSLANFSLYGTSNIDIKLDDCELYSIRTGTSSAASITTNGAVVTMHINNSKIYRFFADIAAYSGQARLDILLTNNQYLRFYDPNGVTDSKFGEYLSPLSRYAKGNISDPACIFPTNTTERGKLFDYIDTTKWISA